MFSTTVLIIIITGIVSFTAFNSEKIKSNFLFWPYEIERKNQYYRFLSYGLIHGDFVHLAFNMITLYSFGEQLERLFSSPELFGENARLLYLILYISGIIVSTIPDYLRSKDDPSYLALGASGAVSAVLFACIILRPKLSLYVFFIPIAIPAYLFGILFLVISAYLARQGRSTIGHSAHITGAIYGLLFTIIATKIFSGYDAVGLFLRSIMNG